MNPEMNPMINKEDRIDIRQPFPLNTEPVYRSERKVTERDHQIAQIFGIPSCAEDLIDFFLTPDDQKLILEKGNQSFSKEDLDPERLKDLFHRGIISKADEEGNTWKLSNFYGMLDVFAVSETRKYRSLPREKRREIDDWYFDSYARSLDRDLRHRPTQDRILTRDEMLAFLDQEDRQLYLNYCDCKSLSGDCGLPSHTCISFTAGTNSFQERGLSMPITKEQAKDIIIQADQAGLVHTLSAHGICNCCDDCCYLFRAQRVRKSVGFWPASEHIVSFDPHRCINCGLCMKRCHFGVFTRKKDQKTVSMDNRTCEGCGLCVNTCPGHALSLKQRRPEEIHINEAV